MRVSLVSTIVCISSLWGCTGAIAGDDAHSAGGSGTPAIANGGSNTGASSGGTAAASGGNAQGSSGAGAGGGPNPAGGGSATGGGFDTKAECAELGTKLSPGPSPVRRLTRKEYDTTLSALLDDHSTPSRDFPPEARALGFSEIAEAQTVTALLGEAYRNAAKEVAKRAAASPSTLLGCSETDSACIDGFIRRMAERAYRRPLQADEAERLRAVFDWGKAKQSARDGVEMVLEVLLQSPDFLYRPEFGGAEVAPGVTRLTSYEMATRLSYLFSAAPPDSVLLAEAAANRLQTSEQVYAQALRLLTLPAARKVFATFHAEWLDLDSVPRLERDSKVYSGFGADTAQALADETRAFIDQVLWQGDGKLSTLLTAPYTMLNEPLAAFYGVALPPGSGFRQVQLDPQQRIGLLTQASLLALHAQPLQTSPVHRGKFIRESLLCQFLPPPPATLMIKPPELDPKLTTRERFAQHSADPSCAGCHAQMDPLGLGLEHFDAVGRYRDTENGHPIDASGHIANADVAGDFDGALELGQKLASSEQVADCMMKQWLRFSYGRSETKEDACSLEKVRAGFVAAEHDLKSLVVELTKTDAFLYRKTVTP